MKGKIVLAGGSGCLGRLLQRHFAAQGFEVVVLTHTPQAGEVGWDGERLGPWTAQLEGAQAVVNLAGRSVDCRYHARNRRLIMDSRIRSTRVLGEAIARCQRPPRVWLNSSTATIYRHTYGPAWDESGETGACAEAKDAWPGVCQSCVSTTQWNARAMRLITGTTWSPSGTASTPPGMKAFCTSTTISASVSRGRIVPDICPARGATTCA